MPARLRTLQPRPGQRLCYFRPAINAAVPSRLGSGRSSAATLKADGLAVPRQLAGLHPALACLLPVLAGLRTRRPLPQHTQNIHRPAPRLSLAQRGPSHARLPGADAPLPRRRPLLLQLPDVAPLAVRNGQHIQLAEPAGSTIVKTLGSGLCGAPPARPASHLQAGVGSPYGTGCATPALHIMARSPTPGARAVDHAAGQARSQCPCSGRLAGRWHAPPRSHAHLHS